MGHYKRKLREICLLSLSVLSEMSIYSEVLLSEEQMILNEMKRNVTNELRIPHPDVLASGFSK